MSGRRPSALATIRQLDAQGPLLPLVEKPERAELQVAPYWGEECISTDTETNLGAAADLIAAALLEAGGMARAASRRLLEQARISLGEPGHALVVGALRSGLGNGIAAGL
jgi:hypothetical protein